MNIVVHDSFFNFLLLKYFYLFVCFYFWLYWVFVAVLGLSLLFVAVRRLLIVVASLAEHGL